jgi:outer membrane receptor for ferrienterochelin and colicins
MRSRFRNLLFDRMLSAAGGRCSHRAWLAAALLVLGAAAPALAQTGTVVGRVTSADTGAPLAPVAVRVISGANIIVGRALTSRDGVFRIENINPGTYSLDVGPFLDYPEVRLPDLRVQAGQTTTFDARLRAAAISLNPVIVEVSGIRTTALEATGATGVVEQAQIRNTVAVTPAQHLKAIPAVDYSPTGVIGSNITVRGFNNIFSGAVQMLTDHRIAGVPSLRVNFMQLIPANNDDLERVELILGPGSALYGPNTANGIVHFFTRSPISSPGTTFSVATGERDVLQAEFRTAHRVNERLGLKVSGNFLQAQEWGYVDPVEQAERLKFSGPQGAFFRQEMRRVTGITDNAVIEDRISRIGERDSDIRRWSWETRLDWRPSDRARTTFSAGQAMLGRSIELTGLGAGQADNWSNSYVQARSQIGGLFVQGYVNFSDAGETYLLRSGQPIRDRSRLWVGQAQHGFALGARQGFIYGVDALFTDPRTEGTIHGIYEDEDQTTEVGGYVQSTTSLLDNLRLIVAGRLDSHTGLPELVFSPRAALVFTPVRDQAFRVSLNRAFSTPSSLNQFLHLGSAFPDAGAAQLGYSLLIQGTGTRGFSFGPRGSYQMRSPFTPAGMGGPGQLLPAAAAATFYPAAVQVAAASAPALFQQHPWLLGFLIGDPSRYPTPAQVGAAFSVPGSGTAQPLSVLEMQDVPAIRESTQNSAEVGYTGIFGDRFRLSADFWFSRRQNFVTPLTLLTPFVLLDGQQLGAYLVQRLMVERQMSQADAVAFAGQLAPRLAGIPVGVISSEDVAASSAQVLVSYYNVDDDLDTYGTDIMAQANLTQTLYARGGVSLVNKNAFTTRQGASVTLNAPKEKVTAALGYRDLRNGLNGEVSARYSGEYPVRSGVYNATACIGGTEPGREECVAPQTLVDVSAGVRIPRLQGTELQMTVQNVLNETFRPFPGMPAIRRMALVRLRYTFGSDR